MVEFSACDLRPRALVEVVLRFNLVEALTSFGVACSVQHDLRDSSEVITVVGLALLTHRSAWHPSLEPSDAVRTEFVLVGYIACK